MQDVIERTYGRVEPEDDGNVVIGAHGSCAIRDDKDFVSPVMDVDQLGRVNCLRDRRVLSIVDFLFPVKGDHAPATSVLSEPDARDDIGDSLVNGEVENTSHLSTRSV